MTEDERTAFILTIEKRDELIADNAKLREQRGRLACALRDLFNDYKELADSGDAGRWSLEDIPIGIKTLAILAEIEGEVK